MQLGSLLREEVHATMYIGIHRIVLVCNGIYHLAGLLRSGSIVQINQWLAIYSAGKDGEISPKPLPEVGIVIHNESEL